MKNNKVLFGILIALIGLYFVFNQFSKRKVRSFKAEIVEVDSAKVTSIEINPNGSPNAFTLTRNGNSWTLNQGTLTTTADRNTVNSLLTNLLLIKAKRIAAKSEEKWADYELEAGKASRILAKAGEEILAEVYVGRFNYNPQAKTAVSYLRTGAEPEVYAIDGFASMSLGQGSDAYRSKNLLRLNKADISQVAFGGNTPFALAKDASGQWAGADGSPVDSAAVDAYLGGLANVLGTNFVNDFTPNTTPTHSLSISGNNFSPTTVEFYATPDREKPFVLKSSTNDAYFASDSSDLYERLIKTSADFSPTE